MEVMGVVMTEVITVEVTMEEEEISKVVEQETQSPAW